PTRAPPLGKKPRRSRRKAFKLLPEASFHRLVRNIFVTRSGFGLQASAVGALREGCEAHLLGVLEEWGLCALHAERFVIRMADVSLVRCLRVKRG
ncbi:H3 protein, partial [Heliornis fulica]|nr:H3 protein [Heliornis fulica]